MITTEVQLMETRLENEESKQNIQMKSSEVHDGIQTRWNVVPNLSIPNMSPDVALFT